MSPEMYECCEGVAGFEAANGYTYSEHIVKIFEHRLSPELVARILQEEKPHNALEILTHNSISFTHDFA